MPMNHEPVVRIVLGEAAEPYPGTLRCVLEGEGFDIVGQASNQKELEMILTGVKPAAIVLGPELGAMPVLTAREKAPNARIVVVWPNGVSAAIADLRVEPSRVYEELGEAVRAATRPLLDVRDTHETAPSPVLLDLAARGAHKRPDAEREPRTERKGLRRGGAVALLVAASFVLLVSAWALSSGPVRSGTDPRTSDPLQSSPAASLIASAHPGSTGHTRTPAGCQPSTSAVPRASARASDRGKAGLRHNTVAGGTGRGCGQGNGSSHANGGSAKTGVHGGQKTAHGASAAHSHAPDRGSEAVLHAHATNRGADNTRTR
jgi:hypothetical protein